MDQWKAGDDVYELMRELIRRHHAERLIDISDQIEIVFREKSFKSGGRVFAGKLSKAPKLMSVLGVSDCKFVLQIGADMWEVYSNEERAALLEHHLYSISFKESKDGVGGSYSIAAPDFVGFKEEIQRYGVWRYLNAENDEEGDNVIPSLFGDAASPQDD